MSRILITLIKGYQYFVSPILGPSCRFTPSCSQYAVEALKERGLWLGMFLSLKRILRCHPWCEGGYDPIPKK